MKKIAESPRISDIERRYGMPVNKLLYHWHWEKNLRHKKIGEHLGIPRPTITRWLRQFGVLARPRERFTNANLLNVGSRKGPRAEPKPRREFPWKWNEEFFIHWTPEMAYVLGFLFADGYVYKNPRGSSYIGFVSTDREIIEKVRTALDSNHKIGVRKRSSRNPKWKDGYYLQIGSKAAVSHLKTLGVVANKSLTAQFPRDLPTELVGSFVRGYFDGDGNVYFGKCHRAGRKRGSYILQSRFTSGSRKFLAGVKCHLAPYTTHGRLTKRSDGSGYSLAYGLNDSLALGSLMYNNVSHRLFLERKHKVFQEAEKVLGQR